MTEMTSTITKNCKAGLTNHFEIEKTNSHQKLNGALDLTASTRVSYGKAVTNFLTQHISLDTSTTHLVDTTNPAKIARKSDNPIKNFVNLRRINDIRYINKFFETVNSNLPVGGTFIGCVEPKNQRKKRILKKYPIGINYIVYALFFLVKRIIPKLHSTKKMYFFLTKGKGRVITRAETLGRLISCGFKIKELEYINGELYFVAKKVSEPSFPQNPTYGMLIKLKRMGKNGKIISVYKLRTMHPFAEYLQDYVYKQNNLEDNGKFKDDFRVATLGKWFRILWIDELPMLINLLKGDLKLVGVRPISQQYFSLYTEELQQKRIKHKPGLIPPFYADLPKTMEEIIASELRYLEAYEKNPLKTDFIYFWKVFDNIVFKRARSA